MCSIAFPSTQSFSCECGMLSKGCKEDAAAQGDIRVCSQAYGLTGCSYTALCFCFKEAVAAVTPSRFTILKATAHVTAKALCHSFKVNR